MGVAYLPSVNDTDYREGSKGKEEEGERRHTERERERERESILY